MMANKVFSDDFLLFVAENAVNTALNFVKKEIDAKTPEDTKTLIWNNKIVTAKTANGKTVGSINNSTPYAIYVEHGVWGKAYDYHKPKWSVMYKWVWAKMYTRTKFDEKVKSKNKEIIQGAFDKFIQKIKYDINGK